MAHQHLVLTGLAAGLILACSDNSSPTPTSPSSPSLATTQSTPTLTEQHSGTTNRLQAVSPVSASVVWASGVGGTYVITRDGGAHWHSAVVPGAAALEFRDVQGISGQEAYLLAAGVADSSRIYHTTDGGDTWQIQFKNRDPNGFYDCFDFWTPDAGLVMADAINGRFPVRRTLDGRFWVDIGDKLPEGQAGEAAFAASGTCVATQGDRNAWIATGGAEHARVFSTTDRGKTWTTARVPMAQGTGGAGVFSVAFRDALHGVIGGGDFLSTVRERNFAVSSDGGKTWVHQNNAPINGAIFGLSYVAKHDQGPNVKRVVATGPAGAAVTDDEGETWTRIKGAHDFWAVAFANQTVGWLVGTDGRISKITF
jgi:photosystem II stability/assembly factor-like uncharacterized protein